MKSEARPSIPRSSIPITIAAGPELDRAIEDLQQFFRATDDDNMIRCTLGITRAIVHDLVNEAGDSNLQKHFRNESEFHSYVTDGSNGEQLVNLLRRMVKGEVPWEDLFKNGTLLSSLWCQVH
jgi:hypothetical protein